MGTLPDLLDPNVSSATLVLGFAYSLTPEGEPGSYNERLAEQLIDLLKIVEQHPTDKRPWIGMQWEIFDAIERQWQRDTARLLELVPLSHVGHPPPFVADDILDVNELVRQLTVCYSDWLDMQNGKAPSAASTEAGRRLASRIASLVTRVGYSTGATPAASLFSAAMFDEVKLAQYLNQLLPDPVFHQAFYEGGQALLELHDMYRSYLSSVGVENRRLAAEDKKLLRFQRIRVNRLIVEAILPDERILRRGKYLSTRGVLDQVADVRQQEGARPVQYGLVYGHPAHSPRCRRQTIESGWEAGWELDLAHVHDVNYGQQWPWDPTTAQMWCRSETNWEDYERMGRARLH